MHTAQVRRVRVPEHEAQSPQRLRSAATPIFPLISAGPDLLNAFTKGAERARRPPRFGVDCFFGSHALLFGIRI